MSPVTASLNDPVFRSWVDSGRIPSSMKLPLNDEDTAFVLRKMDIEYLAQIVSEEKRGDLVLSLVLYRKGKQVFELGYRPDKITTGGNTDWYTMTRNGVRQLYTKLAESSVFNGKPAQVKLPPVKNDPSLVNPPGGGTPAPTPTSEPAKSGSNNGDQALKSAQAALDANQAARAISILRDAIDIEPTRPDLRVKLIEALIANKQYDMAAKEAEHSAELMPSQKVFRELAAKAYLLAGKTDNAQSQMNEAAARSPKDLATLTNLAYIALIQVQFEAARNHIKNASALKETPVLSVYRWIAAMGLGEVPYVKMSSDKLNNLDGVAEAQDNWLEPIDQLIQFEASQLRDLTQQISMNSKIDRAKTDLGVLKANQQSLASVLAAIPAQPKFAKSYERRLVALKLLGEVVSGLQSYTDTPDPEALTDTRLTLGELFRQMKLVREQLKVELGR